VKAPDDPRILAALLAHALVIAAAIKMVVGSGLPSGLRLVVAVLVAAALAPGLRTLASGRSERFARLALLLVLIIGAGLVEVLASGGGPAASVLLGAAMLEFALLFTMTRPGAAPGPNEPDRR